MVFLRVGRLEALAFPNKFLNQIAKAYSKRFCADYSAQMDASVFRSIADQELKFRSRVRS
jgi:hypothetical protein